MKKGISFIVMFFGIAIISIAQSNIAFNITSKNGKIMTQEKEAYCMPFTISGLNSASDIEAFTKTMTSNSIVKKFEIIPGKNEKNVQHARLILNNKEKELFLGLLKSANVTTLNVDNKAYSINDFEQLSKDLKAKNVEKEKEMKAKAARGK